MPLPRPVVVEVADRRTGARERRAWLRSPVWVGRGPDCQLRLAEAFVSGRHGIFQFDDGEVSYTDLGSRNGTLLDGAPLPADVPTRLADGARLGIGTLELSVTRGEPLAEETGEHPAPGALTALLEEIARVPRYGAAEVAAHRLYPGLVVGRFELLREIGRGGFGVVFEANDGLLGRRVAWKALRPGLAAAPPDGLLRREAEVGAQLGHPNIVALHDVGTWEGGAYLVMELLRGESLEARLGRGPLSREEALSAAVDVARALVHAHGAGVVHRDLKPSNVFLASEGYAKVLDFGLAHALGGEMPLAGGTPGYMAPEQRAGLPPDPQSDLYAAALVLRESLTGRCPDPTGAHELPGGLSQQLERLLRSALDEDPRRRPAGARAWLDGLLSAQRQAGSGD